MNDFLALELDPKLTDAIKAKGYTKPTTIQKMAIPVALDGADILASAPTGTGKTAAYILPALQFLVDYPRRKPGPPRILVMVPTRELAYQVHEEANLFAKNIKVRCDVITGGIDYEKHTDALEKNSDLLIATPGRLMEYLENEEFDPNAIELLVIDEADRMLDMGFIGSMRRIAEAATRRRQTMLLSATLDEKGVTDFADDVLTDPRRLEAEPSSKEKGKINQWIHLCDNFAHKQALLTAILKQDQTHKTIVFVKTRERVFQLVSYLQSQDLASFYLQGNMAQEKRNQAIEKFADCESGILVATDVAARGIDISDISHIINFDLPRTSEVYVHRIGRTARAGKKGTAISLVEAHDMAQLARIERYTDQRLKRRVIDELRPKHKEAKVPGKKKVKVSKKVKKGKAKKAAKRASKA